MTTQERIAEVLGGLPVAFERALKTASSCCDAPEHNPYKMYDTQTEQMWCPECVNAALEVLATEGLKKQQANAK